VALADLPAEPERAATVLAGPGRRERIAVRLARKGFSPESISAALGGFAEGGDAA
jgi:SOS response regulatory protein OraA/RecX